MPKTSRGGKPQKKKKTSAVTPPTVVTDYNKAHPRWCFRYLNSSFSFDALDSDARFAFLKALQLRSKMSWGEIITASRKGAGTKRMPIKQVNCPMPDQFRGEKYFMVMRYHGKLPMGGVRQLGDFHVIWIEREFGEVYDHGS